MLETAALRADPVRRRATFDHVRAAVQGIRQFEGRVQDRAAWDLIQSRANDLESIAGLDMPLAFENIFEPIVPRPAQLEKVKALAQRAREYAETVVRDIQSPQATAQTVVAR